MPPQITCASALPGKTGNTKIAFSLKCCISALLEFNQSPLDFFNLFDSRLILTLLYDSLNLVINAFSSRLLGTWFRRPKVERAAAVGLSCMNSAPVRCLLGFLFCKVMQKHWIGEVGKQNIIWFLTFSTTLLQNIIAIGSCTSRL